MATQTMKAMKIMQKPYHLVHDGIQSGEEVVVHPPRLPGLNKDFVNPKNDKGEWIRVFTVADNGSRSMRKGKEIVLTHAPGEVPYCMIDGVRWFIQPIEGVRAVKKRGAERAGFKGTMAAPDANAGQAGEQPVKRGRGRPKGSKNKPKLEADVNAAPKRRGRPPGSKNKPKVGNGNTDAQPKRRGRPPGSKNKPKVGAPVAGGVNLIGIGAAVAQAVQSALASALGVQAPKRRGRPPGSKNKTHVAQTNGNGQKRRGRPPGSKNKNTVTYQKRLAALEKARAVRMAKIKAAKAGEPAKEPETIQPTT